MKGGKRVFAPTPRDTQKRRLMARYGLPEHQAGLIAVLHFGGRAR